MKQKSFQFILINNKTFSIPIKFNHFNDIPQEILQTLIDDPNHQYHVKTNVNEEIFQTFIDYLIEDKNPNIQEDNFYIYFELCEEFNVMDLIFQKRAEINNYLINIKGLQLRNKDFLPKIEEEISQNLDDYLDQEGELLMNAPIQSLYNIFNHCNRHLNNHNLAYELIKNQFEKNHDPNIFILIESLDGFKLSQLNLEESLSLKNLRYNCAPHIEYKKIFLTNKFEKSSNKTKRKINPVFILISIILFFIVFIQQNKINEINQKHLKLKNSMNEINQKHLKLENLMNENQNKLVKNDQSHKIITDNIENEMKKKDAEIKKLKENLLDMLFVLNDESSNLKFDFFIPIGKSWTQKTPTEFSLFDDNKTFTVISSSTWVNDQFHTPNHLFRGKKENDGERRWASNQSPSSSQYIMVIFSDPVNANILLMTSRYYHCDQSPNSFKIFAGNDTNNLKIIKNYSGVEWMPNSQKKFFFNNENSYKLYKIEFTSMKSPNSYYGLAELNLGKVIF